MKPESIALPQQEESTTRKMILWEASGIAENLWREDDNRWNRAIRAYRDEIQKLVSVPIAPLLGQDEPKLKWNEERLRFEKWYAANRMQLYMHLDTQLRCAIEDTCRESWMQGQTQALTSLAVAKLEIDALKGTNQGPAVCGVCKKEHITFWPCDYEDKLADMSDVAAGNLVRSVTAIKRAELAEASLVEAQKRIEELEKELGR